MSADTGAGRAATPWPEHPPTIDESAVLRVLADAVVVADRRGMVAGANPAAEALFGRRVQVGLPLVELVPQRFRSAHQAGFGNFVRTGHGRLVGGGPVQVAALRADGSELPVELTLAVVGEPDDPQFAVVATIRDVSRRVDLERQALLSRYLQATVDAARDGVLAWASDGRVLAVNRTFCELWGLETSDIPVGGNAEAVLARCQAQLADQTPLLQTVGAPGGDASQSRSSTLSLHDGRIVEGYAAPITDDADVIIGRVWYVHDDTERRAVEAQRTALVVQLREAQRSQRFLLDASNVLAHVSGFTETLQALAAVAVPQLGDICLIDVVDAAGRPRRVAAVHADPARQALVDVLRTRYAPVATGTHPSIEAMRVRRSRWSADMSDEFLRSVTRNDEHFRIAKQLGCSSFMTIPLIANDAVLGTVTLLSAGSGRRFGPDDVSLAEELASRVALVIAKERHYDVERNLSHTLQTNLLPTELPTVETLQFAVRYLPGTTDAEVGGDFWDVMVTGSGEVALAIGDVAGHDITAAATMAQLRSACRALRSQANSPDELINLLHTSWDHLGLDRMATALFARLDPTNGKLTIASAGHLPPLIVEPDRAWFPTLDPAAPLGVPGAERPVLWEGELPVGAGLVLYTDGLVEDRHRDIDEGTGRLIRAAVGAATRTPDVLLDHILTALSGATRADDVALLAVQRT